MRNSSPPHGHYVSRSVPSIAGHQKSRQLRLLVSVEFVIASLGKIHGEPWTDDIAPPFGSGAGDRIRGLALSDYRVQGSAKLDRR